MLLQETNGIIGNNDFMHSLFWFWWYWGISECAFVVWKKKTYESIIIYWYSEKHTWYFHHERKIRVSCYLVLSLLLFLLFLLLKLIKFCSVMTRLKIKTFTNLNYKSLIKPSTLGQGLQGTTLSLVWVQQ